VAASVVAVVVGLGVPVARNAIDEMADARAVRQKLAASDAATEAYNDVASRYNKREEPAAREAREAAEQHAVLEEQFARAIADARRQVRDKEFIVRLSGPGRAQPGAVNQWRVEMFKRDGAPALPGKIEWQLKDANGAVVYADAKLAPTGQGFLEPQTINLPIAVWSQVKPDSELTLEVVAHENNLKSKVNARLPLAQPVFVTHLATDKPLYKPGETVFFRSLTLDRATFTPPDKDMTLEFRLTRPGGRPEPIVSEGVALRGNARGYTDTAQPLRLAAGPDKKPIRGIGCGQFEIPPGAPGGEYTLSVVDITPSFDEVRKQPTPRDITLETRKFNVIEYKPENILKTLEFDGKSYGAGETVLVKATAEPVQGGKRKLIVAASAQVDGKNVPLQCPKETDTDGVVRFKIFLPAMITRGEGTVSVSFFDGADQDVITRPIPLIGRSLNVEFFPEGGDLVEGIPNRVYFQATTPSGKPADLKGYITDGRAVVAEVATLTNADHPGVNRGQGVFTFTPAAGKTYWLKPRQPTGIAEPLIKNVVTARDIVQSLGLTRGALGAGSLATSLPTGYELPKAKADGVVLTARAPVTEADEPIRVSLATGVAKKTLHVGAYSRGNLLDHRVVEVEAGQPVDVALKPSVNVGGVTRVTVFEDRGMGKTIPVAERLVYHKPGQSLALLARADRPRYNPGSRVSLDLQAMNEDDRPTAAIVMVAVVNQNTLTMADDKTGRLMPTHFLLASEVKKPEDLEHADFLLGADPEAGAALDLLLGTQGWRRFAEQQLPSPKSATPEVDRLLVANGQRSAMPLETLRQELNAVQGEYRPKIEESLSRLTTALDAHAKIEEEFGRSIRGELLALGRAKADAQADYYKALARLRDQTEASESAGRAALLKLCVGLGFIALVCVGVAVWRRANGLGYVATAAGCLGLCAFALLGTSLAEHGGELRQEVAFNTVQVQTPEGDLLVQQDESFTANATAMDQLGALGEKKTERGEGREKGAGFGGGGGPGDALNKRREMRMMPMAAPPMAAQAGMLNGNRNAFDADKFAKGALKPMDEKAKAALADGMRPMARDQVARQQAARELLDGRRDLAEQAKFDRGLMPGAGRFQEMEALRKAQMQRLRGAAPLREKGQVKEARLRMADAQPQGWIAPEDYEQFMFEGNQESGFYVREYRFQKHTPAHLPETRDDFTETVYWHPALVMPESGRAEIEFQLSDSIARYQVLVAGHTLDGRIGATVSHIEARKPFSVDPKVPIEITAGDRVDVPVRVVNDSEIRRTITFKTVADGLTRATDARETMPDSIDLTADQKSRKVLSFRSSKKEGDVSLTVESSSDPVETPDLIVRKFRVVPEGFPASGAVSDLLEKRANATITLPEVVKGSLKLQVLVYPTSLADLQGGLEGLMREPGGCFEQTSTSNYPNLLILDYLKSSDQAKPELAQRAKGMLDRGYAKLIAFECPDSADKAKHGFEWFGQMDQQHQALTAYGLLQFKDLDRAYPGKVDPELIRRTQQYLLSQQTPNKDGFKRNSRALDSFGRAPEAITNAYIVWALTESDPDDKENMVDLAKQLDALKKQAKDNNDPYFLALVANALLRRPTAGNREEALAILDRIVEKNLKNGCVEGAATSITCSGGRDLQIEATALATLGWLRSGEPTRFIKPVKDATKWIGQQRGGYGGFGSTQSTILALRALIEHTKASRKPAEAGEITLTVNGKTFRKAFTEKDQEVITLDIPNPEDTLKQGDNEAVVEINTKEAYPFSLSWSANTLTPLSAEKCLVEVATKLDREQVLEGETVRVNVSLKNKVDQAHGMAVAIIGLPGGCRLPADLKELTRLREENRISYFEVRGRELVIYWRALKPNEMIDVSFNALCEVPGQYSGPASRGYLYYNADQKHWVKPLAIGITAANQPGEEAVASK
jgi:tetratricopeptide (TPR) repeat protein